MRSDKRKMNPRLIGAIGLVVVGGILLTTFHGALFRGIAFVQRPFVVAGTWIYDQTFGWGQETREVQGRIRELEQRQEALAVDFAELERLRIENEQLRTQLGFLERRSFKAITTSITSRSIANRSARFTIDRGFDDGVRVGAPVIVGDGIMVGKVHSTTASTATVTALTDPAIGTAATLLNETRTIGVAEGITGTLLGLRYVPQDEPLAVDDLVVTSGLEELVPSGLLLGVVNAVRKHETEPFQEAIVEPLADARRLHVVSVLTSSTEPSP